MAKRKIIEIDREKCNGCGLCTTACAEGALVLDGENKAVITREIYCDGLGACLDVCPTDALRVVERESPAYDAQAACRHVLDTRGPEAARQVHGVGGHDQGPERSAPAGRVPMPQGCPGSRSLEVKKVNGARPGAVISGESELSQWPIQLHLVSPQAPTFNESDLLVAADCTAFASARFHQDFLKGKKLIIACPKLDDTTGYVEKLAEILRRNAIASLTVVIMTVPCCSGLFRMVEEAVARSGQRPAIKRIVVGLDGSIVPPPAGADD
jgi:ferredoxin